MAPPAPPKPPAAPPTGAPAAQPPLAAPIERRQHSDNIDASSLLWNDWNKFVENYWSEGCKWRRETDRFVRRST